MNILDTFRAASAETVKNRLEEAVLEEAYHQKDRSARREISDSYNHHNEMMGKHRAIQGALSKDKDVNKHDMAMMAHQYAAGHFGNMQFGLPQDFHDNRDFYDKLNGLVSKNANEKSKDCGVDCKSS